jgi:tetratricopeptide (TPR) repeat protein
MAVTSVRNETPSRLTLVSIEGDRMVLAPLQQKAIGEDSPFDFDELERRGLVSQQEEAPRRVSEQFATVLVGGGFWLVIIAAIVVNQDPWLGIPPGAWPYAVWGGGLALLLLAVTIVIIRGTNSFALVRRWTLQTAALMVILAIGIGLPAAAIYFFGGGQELLSAAEGLALPVPGDATATSSTATSLALFGRLMQLTFIAVASLLPVLLFFLFDRYKLDTLRNRLYANIFRLDDSVSTTGEIDAKYGSQIREAYGTDDRGRGRLTPATRWPVLVCAFVITVGWIVALAPVGAGFDPENAAEVLAGLLPQRSPLVFGFLGVYFFSLQSIAIRYARGDLKPKAYTHIMVRVFLVAVLTWVLGALFDGTQGQVLALAFVFGYTPDEFFTWLKGTYRSVLPEKALRSPSLPLTELEGIDLYDLSRLESEGIVNIEGLAHHELMELIIETRIPVPRLIDWLDQAILFLHVAGDSDSQARVKLREYGIRTATDLLQTWQRAEDRGAAELTAFKKLLGGEAPLYRLEVIRDALLDDEWMRTVRCWRDDHPRPAMEREAVPTTIEGLVRRAGRDLEAGRYRRAIRLLEESLNIQDTAAVRRQLARVLATSPVVELRNPDAAREHARRAFELAPTSYENMVELIRIHIDREDVVAARSMHEVAWSTVEAWPSSRKRQKAAEEARLRELLARIEDLETLVGKDTPDRVPSGH